MLDSKNRFQIDNLHKFIDLSSILAPPDEYVCEECGIRLVLYPQARIANPHAGTSYICPKCHNVTDSSLTGMQRPDEIKPIEIALPSFNIVPERKGNELLFNPEGDDDHDPEPQEEERLKATGATIISKKIEAKNDFR